MLTAPPSILITDDDDGFRETVCGVLAPHGYQTLTASDGEEAVEIVRSREVHLVLLDVHMPRLGGLETLRRVKEMKALLPCIILSARLDEMIERQARLAHAFSVLPKPVGSQQLRNVVAQAFRRTYNWPA